MTPPAVPPGGLHQRQPGGGAGGAAALHPDPGPAAQHHRTLLAARLGAALARHRHAQQDNRKEPGETRAGGCRFTSADFTRILPDFT